jgi:hypothetical protein
MSARAGKILPLTHQNGEGHDYVAFVLTLQTHNDKTLVNARLARDISPRGRNLDLGSVWLSLGRAALAGQTPRGCIALLCRQLWAQYSDALAEDDPVAEGCAVPLGTTGGTVTKDSLPGL